MRTPSSHVSSSVTGFLVVLVRAFGCLLISLPLLAAAQSPKDIARDLKGKTVFLRGMYAERDLNFDAHGNPTTPATPGPFSTSAIKIGMARLGSGILQIEGFRCVILNPGGNDDPGSLAQLRFIPASTVDIVINTDPSRPDALKSTVDRIFAFSLDDALAGKSTGERRYALYTLAALTRPEPRIKAMPRETPPPASETNPVGPDDTEPVMRPGNGVTIPRAAYTPTPEYTDEARKKKLNGVCILGFIVDKQGFPMHIRVERPLDPGLDEKAIAAASQYRFSPAMFNGEPVPVQIAVEMNFRLY